MQFHFRMVDPLVSDFLREYLISSGATFYDFYRFFLHSERGLGKADGANSSRYGRFGHRTPDRSHEYGAIG